MESDFSKFKIQQSFFKSNNQFDITEAKKRNLKLLQKQTEDWNQQFEESNLEKRTDEISENGWGDQSESKSEKKSGINFKLTFFIRNNQK